MDEIVVPKQILIIGLVLVGLIATAIWVAPQILSDSLVQAGGAEMPTPPTSNQAEKEDAAAGEAVLAGARAFYTVDYKAGQQKWLDQLCAVSTQTGCIVYQNIIVPNLWSQLEEGKIATTVQLSEPEKIEEQVASTRDNAPAQIWRLEIQLSSPWPMQREPITEFPALALVIMENGVWKFERFLTEEELQAYSLQGGQP